jgi:hypothetical protein
VIPRVAALLACVSLSSCATTLSTAARGIVPADDKMVADCKFVGDVQGSSGFGNVAASVGMENAKNEALEKAAKLGATHVVFVTVSGGYSPYATGKAYKCS